MTRLKTLVLTGLLLSSLGACTPVMKFTTSTVVPAATGDISVRKDRNQNYEIQVRILNLAEPKQLTPPRDVYIVWMDSNGNPTKKLGRITTSTGVFSKTLKAELNTTSTTKPTRIFVSAETNPDVESPEGTIVLTTS